MQNKERHDAVVELEEKVRRLELDNKRLVSENRELEIMMDAHDGVHVKVKAPACEIEVEVEAPSFKVKAPSCEVEVEVKVETPKASGKRSGGKKAVKPKARASHAQAPPIADDELTEKFFMDIFDECDEDETDMVTMEVFTKQLDQLIPRNAKIQGLKNAIDITNMILEKEDFEETLQEWLEELHHWDQRTKNRVNLATKCNKIDRFIEYILYIIVSVDVADVVDLATTAASHSSLEYYGMDGQRKPLVGLRVASVDKPCYGLAGPGLDSTGNVSFQFGGPGGPIIYDDKKQAHCKY